MNIYARTNITSSRGFTLAQLVVVIAIVIIITSIGMGVFISARKSNELSTTADQIGTAVELARDNALAGKYGLGSGVNFGSTTYIYFTGNSYDSSTTTNKTYAIPSGYQITTTPSNLGSIIFTRLTGVPQTMATVTVTSLTDATKSANIVIGSQGDVSVIK